jgi:hypothetical protein
MEVLKASQKCPRFPPHRTRRRWRARRRRGEARGGKQAAGKCDWAHLRSIGGGSSAGEVAGEWRRRRGRGGSDSGEDRGGAQQCVAQEASRWPREGARWVTGRGGSAEGRARQWRPGGSRGSADSGETSALLGHQARLEAHVWDTEELRATGRSRGRARRRAHRRR